MRSYPRNHTSVWGSFWKNGQWGYKCCHSTIKASYCAGKEGIAALEAHAQQFESAAATEQPPRKSLMDELVSKASNSNTKDPLESKKRVGEGSVELDSKKLKLAMEMEKEGKDNNSKYNSLNTSNEITEEELEAYRINRKRAEDPMANYVDHEYD